VRATTTITFTLPKRGLLMLDGPRHAGEVWVGDIGVPMQALREIGVEPPTDLFGLSEIFKLAPA
jgi:hypothetical protein